MNETELILQLKSQDEKAIRFFVERYQQQVFTITLKFVFNSLDAEDLTQESFMDALSHINTYDEQASLTTWLYRITVNRCLMYIRAQKRKKRFAIIRSIFQTDEDEPIAIEDKQASAERDLMNLELSQQLKTAIERLPENQRMAFSLIYLSEFSYAEVAQILEVSVKAIESLLSRAKSKLRLELKEFSYENAG